MRNVRGLILMHCLLVLSCFLWWWGVLNQINPKWVQWWFEWTIPNFPPHILVRFFLPQALSQARSHFLPHYEYFAFQSSRESSARPRDRSRKHCQNKQLWICSKLFRNINSKHQIRVASKILQKFFGRANDTHAVPQMVPSKGNRARRSLNGFINILA